MRIGVSGASGHVGAAVMAELLRRAPEHELVAITRTPERVAPPAAGRLGDYDRPATLATAYARLDRLLIIPSADLRPGVRGAQGIAAIDAAVAAGVGHIVLLSATGTRAKAEPAIGAAYWVAEQRLLRGDATGWTILRMNYFGETLAEEARLSLGRGVLTGLAENRVAYVSREDVATAAAGSLVGDGHIGAIYNLTGPASVSGAERAAMIADASGAPLSFAILTDAQLRGGLTQAELPAYAIDALASMQASLADGAYDIVTGDVEKLSGRAPRPLRGVLEDWSWPSP